MKMKSISVKNSPPISLFIVDNLSDIVIIAGPNGVGKSRLMGYLLNHLQNPKVNSTIELTIEATNVDESNIWKKNILTTSKLEDNKLLTTTLQQSHKRSYWKNSILYFESDRSIQQIQPYQFTWEILDPSNEQVGWNTTFGGIKNRYQDTVHSIFKLIEHQKRSIANKAVSLRNEGKNVMSLDFEDPLKTFKDAFSQLLSPKKLLEPSAQNQTLQYEYNGKIFNFETLSSGEKEVVTIVFDFILRKPEDCIIIFDEPELHLHPELSYKLIQTLKNIGKNNQFILCTHSPDIISSSLDSSVIFLAPPKDENFNQGIIVKEDDETNQALKLLGHSIGIVALGKKIVLIEGSSSSLDKQVYGSIIKSKYSNLVLVPTGSKDEIISFSKILEKILCKTIWGVEFFMLTDRDAITQFAEIEKEQFPEIEKEIAGKTTRFRILQKYHLENYFLDENVWASVFAQMEPKGSWLTNPKEIREKIRLIAKDFTSYIISLTVSSLLRTKVGNIDIMPPNCHSKNKEEVEKLIIAKSSSEVKRLLSILDENNIKKYIHASHSQVCQSIDNDTNDWKDLIPGKPILSKFITLTGMQQGRAKNLYINEVQNKQLSIFDDILKIFEDFSKSL
ncbi:MAG: hypothetical protein LiPW30_711 [Parcubacteria group bacterium LiPW_30]|nr:MAG: hypothetical protein LiPW30_711 [Parcubacteria group bacterium LiPW_30]